MSVTIATHNGSSVSREHNIRNRKVTDKEEHIDKKGEFEIWHDEKIRTAYDRIFGDALAEYNAKQTREDRKIKSYYNHIKKDAKKHECYEMIVGIYGYDCDKETGKKIMREFVENWQERNPNLEMIGAYYHADERGEPHVHIDYIPVAYNLTRGLETQNALVKALGQMGFEKSGKETAQILWEHRENQYLEQLCRNEDLIVSRPTLYRDAEHLHKREYIERQELRKENDKLREENKKLDISQVKIPEKNLLGKIWVSEEQYQELEFYRQQYGKLHTEEKGLSRREELVKYNTRVNEKKTEELQKRENDLEIRSNSLDLREKDIKIKEQKINAEWWQIDNEKAEIVEMKENIEKTIEKRLMHEREKIENMRELVTISENFKERYRENGGGEYEGRVAEYDR